ncbi:MAG: DMT family transporter [Methyloversatilis discipulorum]|uniref:DMT family transporter n=1 Tax=Methyloversatilis discipulorum TaxID=1119528 RepID=UPI0026E9DD67|nr:DMT family transporter [Methyloversatilis discipulorum]MBV5288017.1 DMT family transporter [Methyloversatilis discipulorum]
MRTRVEFLLLALIWGASFALYRVAIPELGLPLTVGLRLALASAALLAVFGWPLRAVAPPERGRVLFWLLLAGAGSTALPFVLFAETVMRSSAGFAAVLNATSPLFSALLGVWVWREAVSRSKQLGLLLGFAGVAVLATLREVGTLRVGMDAVALGLAGAASYGLCVQWVKRRLHDVEASAVATGFSLVGALALLPWALTSLPDHLPSGSALLAVAVLGLVSTALANALYFRLVGRMGATQALSVTFLIPPFAMLWGHLLFDERPTLAMLASTVVILVGTALSLGWRRTSGR